MTSSKEKSVKTTCPYCGVGCGVLATRRRDGGVDIKGDPEHPANFGRLCSKGSALADTISLEGRLLFPEVNGIRADWDSALDLVAEKFSEAVRLHGPDSVGFYVSGQILTEDYYVANKLMKGFIGSANIDTNSRLCMASTVAGHRKAFGSDTVPGTYEDLELADLIVLVGSNLAWCHPVLYQRIEAAKSERPDMKVVLIDPRKTSSANLADLHLAINPDGDTALFCGLLCYLSMHGFIDTGFVQDHTRGFETALSSASALSFQEVADQTGIPKHHIQQFYKLFAKTDKVVTVFSQGVNQSICGTDKVSAILNCHLATGRIGKPGMGPFSVTGQPNAMGGREVGGLANMLAGHLDIENDAHRAMVQKFWQAPTIPKKPGLKAVDMFQAAADGKIKALWIMSTNPVDSLPEANTVKRALETCPFVVVSDILEETDTIEFADVKLPASAWGEKNGTVTNSERRISRQRKFLETPGAARPDWWQFAEVAKRMGYSEAFDFSSEVEIFREHAQLSSLENNGSRDFDIGKMARVSKDAFQNLEPFQWPLPIGHETNDQRFFADGKFYTDDQKARFVAVKPISHSITSLDLPFTLNTGRVRDHWHTMTRTARAARLSSHMAEPFCEMHSEDAVNLGLKQAELVNIENQYGTITVRILITTKVKKGSLFVPMHWTDQFASSARVDVLVPARLDPSSGQPASKNVAVKISPVNVGAYGFMVSRVKPNLKHTQPQYWATAKCNGGWRTEFAFATMADAMRFGESAAIAANGTFTLDYNDPLSSGHRIAAFSEKHLKLALYLSKEPVLLSREWLVSQLDNAYSNTSERQKVLAGRADAAMPDKGRLVCSCHQVGANEINAAIHSGSITISQIGKCLKAGTNCGSCRAEITGMINEHLQETKIAAE
ncbi:MAG: nitrate reductase [Pseudomonadota bacterium]